MFQPEYHDSRLAIIVQFRQKELGVDPLFHIFTPEYRLIFFNNGGCELFREAEDALDKYTPQAYLPQEKVAQFEMGFVFPEDGIDIRVLQQPPVARVIKRNNRHKMVERLGHRFEILTGYDFADLAEVAEKLEKD